MLPPGHTHGFHKKFQPNWSSRFDSYGEHKYKYIYLYMSEELYYIPTDGSPARDFLIDI